MDWNPIKKLNTTVKTSFNLARPLTEKKGWWSVETGLLKSWCREDVSSINPSVGLRWNRCLRPRRDQLLTTVSGINRQLVLLLSKVHQNVVVPENCGKLLDNLPRYVRTLKGSGINGKLLGYFLKMQSERLYVFKDTGSGNLRQNYLLTFQGTSELHTVSGINGKLFGYIPKCIRTLVRFQKWKTSTSFFVTFTGRILRPE